MSTTAKLKTLKSEDSPLDLEHLQRQTLGEDDLKRQVLTLFLTHSDQYIHNIKTAETQIAWRNAAHTLKGAARAIGAYSVADEAEALEGLEITDKLHDDKIDDLVKSMADVKAFITTYLAQ